VSETNPHVDVQGTLTLKDGILRIKPLDLPITGITGQLAFTEDTVTAKHIKSQLLGYPFFINIQSPQANYVDVTGTGTFNPQSIKDYVDLQRILQGQTSFKLHLGMPLNAERHQSLQLTLASDLQGLAVNLPAPLGKTSAEVQSSHLDFDFSTLSQMGLAFRYGGQINGVMSAHEKDKGYQFYNGNLHFGPELAVKQTAPGLFVDGTIPYLDINAWQQTIKQLKNAPKKSSQNATHTSTESSNNLLRRVDLLFNQLQTSALTLKNIQVTVAHSDNGWLINLNNPNILGFIEYPDNFPAKAIALNFEKINIPAKKSGSNTTSSQASKLKPTAVPPIDFFARSLVYGKMNLANVGVLLKPVPGGVQIQSLQIEQPHLNLTAHGAWMEQGQSSRTTFTGQVQSDNYGNALKALDLTDNIDGQNGTLTFDLAWPGSPSSVALTQLSGKAKVKLGPGRVVNIGDQESNIVLGKMISLLSLQSLMERFKSSFSDLYEGGYPFTEMQGEFDFNSGNLMIPNAYLDGTVARLEWNGLIDLVGQNYDLMLLVTPHYTSSLPVLVTVAGTAVAGPIGLLAGAATWAATKVASKQIDKATTYTYKVTGSLDKPQITEVKGEA